MTLTPVDSGWIEVICGNMFSGKTEELIRRIRRSQIAKMSTIIVKPKIDSRYNESHIVSHNQLKLEAHMVDSSKKIVPLTEHVSVVAIDEAQFFDDSILDVCKQLAADRKRVVVAGLDTDYRGHPFGPMPQLMCEADYLDKLRAICVQCGNPASYTQRKTADAEQIVIGELDKYEARCRNCFQPPEEI